jgi:hypothetical protein
MRTFVVLLIIFAGFILLAMHYSFWTAFGLIFIAYIVFINLIALKVRE